MPSSGHASYVSIEALSCPTSKFCIAVGSSPGADSASGDPIAETWNGSSWSERLIPGPRGGIGSGLNGVACSSGSECMAVGEHNTVVQGLVTSTALAMRWDGSRWTIEPTPNPPSVPGSGTGTTVPGSTGNAEQPQSDQLVAVSCPSSGNCVAVGNVFPGASDGTFAEHWDGNAWSLEPTPDPATVAQFSGVSCGGPSSCVAVGYSQPTETSAQADVPLVTAWNGQQWKVERTPVPPSSADNRLSAISCPSTAACTAVGYDGYGSGPSSTLAEKWDGRKWSIQSTPNPSPGSESGDVATTTSSPTAPYGTVEPTNVNELTSVDCTGPAECLAVGGFIDGEAAGHALVERYSP